MSSIQKQIVLLGAGNLAYHLGKRLSEAGVPVIQVFSRNLEKARTLAQEIGAQPISRFQEITTSASLFILALSDDVIGPVAEQLAAFIPADKAVVHTSGATPSIVLQPYFRNYGIYPLQTFSRERPVDFSQIPICIYSPESTLESQLSELGRQVSEQVLSINDEERAVLHVAAVFVNNFANHLFHIGHHILEEEGLPFQSLLPLIHETVAKIEGAAPATMQTGPARRGDQKTMGRHLAYLKKFPKFETIYQLLSDNISEQYEKK